MQNSTSSTGKEEQESLGEKKVQRVLEALKEEEKEWGAAKDKERSKELLDTMLELGPLEPVKATKRDQEQPKGKRAKKLKYPTMGADWGREKLSKEQLEHEELPDASFLSPPPLRPTKILSPFASDLLSSKLPT